MADGGVTVTRVPELEQLRQLTEIGRAFTYATSLDQVERLTVERGAALLAGNAAVLLLVDPAGQWQLGAAHGVADHRLLGGHAAQGDIVTRLPEFLDTTEERVLAVPLVVGGAVTGLLAVAMPTAASSADEWLLSALADQAAVALEQARLGADGREALEQRLRASEGATSAKDRALATLAHDIRSPLGAIDGYCSNIQEGLHGPVTESQRHALSRIRMSGAHLLSLLDNVMDMARLNGGSMPLCLEPLRLAEVAREAGDIMAAAAVAKRQRFEQSSGSEVQVLGDRARIRQLLVNLIGNAVKFTPEEGSITVVTTARSRGGTEWGEVCVIDTGPGIPATEHDAVFEPYYRAEDAMRAPGIGLGLAISRELALRMGGELTLESEVGVGSRFSLRLPVYAGG